MSRRLLLGSCLWVNYKACAVAERGPSPAQGAAACIPTPILNIWQLALLSVLEWVRNTNVIILSGIFRVLYVHSVCYGLHFFLVISRSLLLGSPHVPGGNLLFGQDTTAIFWWVQIGYIYFFP